MRSALLIVVLAAACARVEESPPRVPEPWETAGGSRLRPIFVTLPGGVRSFVAFEDRQRGERCVPGGQGDQNRCLPPILWASVHADPECTMPAAADADCWVGPKLISVEGALFTTKMATRAYDNRGGCQPIERPESLPLLQADQPVRPEDFVAFRTERVDVGSRLQLTMLIGEDGSRYASGPFYDTTLGIDCSFVTAADGSVRCLPYPTTQYWDATCSFRVTGYRDSAPRVVATAPESGLAPSGAPRECNRRAFSATDLGRVPLARRDSSGACVPLGFESTAVRIGDELPPETFELETREKVGDTRITQWVRTIGRARIATALEDRELGVACSFALDGGAYRCLPSAIANSAVYADEACSSPLLCNRALCGGERRYMIDPAGRCAWTVRKIGPVMTPPALTFSSHFGICAMNGSSLTCDALHEVGAVVPTASLATGNVVVE